MKYINKTVISLNLLLQMSDHFVTRGPRLDRQSAPTLFAGRLGMCPTVCGVRRRPSWPARLAERRRGMPGLSPQPFTGQLIGCSLGSRATESRYRWTRVSRDRISIWRSFVTWKATTRPLFTTTSRPTVSIQTTLSSLRIYLNWSDAYSDTSTTVRPVIANLNVSVMSCDDCYESRKEVTDKYIGEVVSKRLDSTRGSSLYETTNARALKCIAFTVRRVLDN